MSDKIGEKISALVDGELDDLDRISLIESLERDPVLLNRWERYHLIGDVIRNKRPPALDGSLADRVSRALEAEPVLLVRPAARPLPINRRQVAGWAIAASIAAVTVIGVRSMVQEDDAAPGEYVAAGSMDAAYLSYVQSPGMRWDSARPEVESRLNHYLANHSEYASTPGMHGRLPYMRMAGYESE